MKKNHFREVVRYGCVVVMTGWLVFLVIPVGLYLTYEHFREQSSSNFKQ